MRNTLALFLTAVLLPGCLEAAWYDFARNENAPEIAELQVAGRQMEDIVEVLSLFPDELKGGKIVVRGKAETTRGNIGAVLVSVDAGANFEKAKVERSGAFFFDFTPVLEREYELQVKVLDTSGRGSDPKAGAFKIAIRADKSRAEALALFDRLLEVYKAKDREAFMASVAETFEGSRAALEEGLEKDFSSLSSIDIQPSILRVGKAGGVMEVQFSFTRRVQSRTSGKILTDRSVTSMSFIREGEEFKLYSMSAPLIFGIAASGNVATSVEMRSGGDSVLTVTEQGDAVKVEQQQSVVTTENQVVSNIVAGTLNVTCSGPMGSLLCPSVSLDSRTNVRDLTFVQQRHAENMLEGEVSVAAYVDVSNPSGGSTLIPQTGPCMWVVEPNSGILDTGKTVLTDIKTVSSDVMDYSQAIPGNNEVVNIILNRVYAVKTPTLYALLKATSLTCTYTPPVNPPGVPAPDSININATFQYRVQLSQNPSFY
ncbi:MAG: hypothetical protein Q7R35_09085 [Elusimicrobiota bacterium]|nr:hypothetical protein [Elusimicrobiota bacterium]